MSDEPTPPGKLAARQVSEASQPEAAVAALTATLNPTVVVEILSPSTESYDRGDKFERYRQLASLQEYVLVSYREPLIEVFRRDDGAWPRTETCLRVR
jgi:Uma2 family endonuclease